MDNIFRKSKTKNKKYDAYYNGRWIPFGDVRYQHYKDSTGLGLYSHLDHKDKYRRANYRARHKAVLLKDKSPAYKNKNSPAYWAYTYLW